MQSKAKWTLIRTLLEQQNLVERRRIRCMVDSLLRVKVIVVLDMRLAWTLTSRITIAAAPASRRLMQHKEMKEKVTVNLLLQHAQKQT